jgi:hypothetical protein
MTPRKIDPRAMQQQRQAKQQQQRNWISQSNKAPTKTLRGAKFKGDSSG